MELSVVIPVYHSEATIRSLVEELQETLNNLKFEIILVNDGSKDNSEAVCEGIVKDFRNVTLISLRKNFGEHNAVMCGLNHSEGDYVVIIDDDFQNPPSQIEALLKKATDDNHDVVYASYGKKYHSPFRNFGSWVNHKVANLLLDKPKRLYLSSFKVIRKEVVQEIVKYTGPFPYVDGLILRVTNNIGVQKVEHAKRRDGKSTYSLGKLVRLYLNMFFNFSVIPIRLFTFTGLIAFILGVIFSIYVVWYKMTHPNDSVGWASLIIAIMTFSGFQILFLGLLGEYLGKNYLDQNNSPQWVIKKISKKGNGDTEAKT